MISIRPETQREHQIARSLGRDNWEIVEKRLQVVCLDNGPGTLIRKGNHIRWIRSAQVEERG